MTKTRTRKLTPPCFERTVAWAIQQGIETASFHILTPYPGTALHQRMTAQGASPRRTGISTTRAMPSFQPAKMSAKHWRQATGVPIRSSNRWVLHLPGASVKAGWAERLRHVAYAGGWKKCEPLSGLDHPSEAGSHAAAAPGDGAGGSQVALEGATGGRAAGGGAVRIGIQRRARRIQETLRAPAALREIPLSSRRDAEPAEAFTMQSISCLRLSLVLHCGMWHVRRRDQDLSELFHRQPLIHHKPCPERL